MKFLECSVLCTREGTRAHVNKVINLSKVITFTKSMRKRSPDDEGIPLLVFWVSDGCSLTWSYNCKKERDADYNKILRRGK